MSRDPVDRLRRICLTLPDTNERLSHGSPSFFIRDKKQFVSVDDHHHGAAHVAFWCPAVAGAQELLIAEDPDWDEIAAIVTDAYRLLAPKQLAAQLGSSQPPTG